MINSNNKFKELNNIMKKYGFYMKVENYYFKTIKIYHNRLIHAFTSFRFLYSDFLEYDNNKIIERLQKIYKIEYNIQNIKKINDFHSMILEYKKNIRKNKIKTLYE